MSRIKPCLQALLVLAVSMFAPVLAAAALPFIQWDKTATPDVGGTPDTATIRGDLPEWLAWLGTPDERLPGGLYEPTVKKLLALAEKVSGRLGKYATAYYWIGVRNRAHGLAHLFRKPMTNHFNSATGYVDVDGLLERDGLWRYYKRIGPLCFVAGYRSYWTEATGYFGVPVFTLKKADDAVRPGTPAN